MYDDRSVLTRPASAPDAVVSYGDEAWQIADVRHGLARHALLIMIHGGFWRPEYDRTHTGPLCVALAAAGWTTASIEYRRIPARPQATLDDVLLAVEQLPALIQHHNGRVIVMGHSAGGHLALWAATQRATTCMHGVLALAPVADLQVAHRLRLDGDAVPSFLGGEPQQHAAIDPAQLATPSIPVTIVHGTADSIVPPAVAESYCLRHPDTRLVLLPDAGHFALIDPLSAAWPAVIAELQRMHNLTTSDSPAATVRPATE